jgi:UTP--glucose-1-phosphate uridylyltransferase
MTRDFKLLVSKDGRIDYGNRGDGSILASLTKFKIFDTWEKQGIKYVNFVGSDNINARACDPLSLSYLIDSNFDCLADVVTNMSDSLEYPCVLRKDDGTYDQFFPFEMEKINRKESMCLGKYSVPYLNIYCRVKHVSNLCIKNHHKIFKQRIREKNDGQGYQNIVSGKETHKLPENFRFAQNIFTLMSLSPRNCLVVRNSIEMLLWNHKTYQGVNEIDYFNNLVQQMIQNSKNHVSKLGRDFTHIPTEKVF